MDERRIGRSVRALRARLRLRQVDVGRRARVSQTTVSLVECGRIGRLRVATVRAVVEAVGGEWEMGVRWHGADLDRLVDGRHAALVGEATLRLEAAGWTACPEVSFSVYGERGSIDLIGWHGRNRHLLVVEAKTALGSLEETLRRHDVKCRLGAGIAADRFGWRAAGVSRLLVLPDASTPRRQVERTEPVMARAYPVRGAEMRLWLRDPSGTVAGLLFLSPSSPGDGGGQPHAARRVRRPAEGPGGVIRHPGSVSEGG